MALYYDSKEKQPQCPDCGGKQYRRMHIEDCYVLASNGHAYLREDFLTCIKCKETHPLKQAKG